MRRPGRPVVGLRIGKKLPSSGPGFLTLERFMARNLYAGGAVSEPYRFEVVHRRGVDAVAIFPFFYGDGRRRSLKVLLKVGFRPGLYLRARLPLPVPDRRVYTFMYEAVAGSLEPRDRGDAGVDRRARAELFEETGLRPQSARIVRLGAGFFPSHGQSTEKIHLRAFPVDPSSAGPPPGDGSINEGDSGTFSLEAGRILQLCRRGSIEDPKVEIGVSRLCRRLGYKI
ncbi:MAG TPA: hypothetical protein VGA64_01845 [Candidatus Polarisedimenticolia bacterium]